MSRSTGNMIQLSLTTQATFQIKQVPTHLHYHPLLEEDSKNKKQVWRIPLVSTLTEYWYSERWKASFYPEGKNSPWSTDKHWKLPVLSYPSENTETAKNLEKKTHCLLIPMDFNFILSPLKWIWNAQYDIPNDDDDDDKNNVSSIFKALQIAVNHRTALLFPNTNVLVFPGSKISS